MTITSAAPPTTAPLPRAGANIDGLALLEGVRAGELPPPAMATLIGFEIRSLDRGAVTFTLVPGEQHDNGMGIVHGGVAASLLDTAMGCAVQTLLPAGVGYTTLDLNVRYLRAMTFGTGTVVATGTVQHAGRRTAIAEAQLVAEATGKLLATATSTLLIVPS